MIQASVCLITKLRLLTDWNSLCLLEDKAQILEDQLEKGARPVIMSADSVGHISKPRRVPNYCPSLLLNVQNLLDK